MADEFKKGFLKRVSELDRTAHLKNAATAAAFLGTEIVAAGKRQDEFATILELIQERLAKAEKASEDSAVAIGELQVENEKLRTELETMKKHLAKRFSPIDAALVKLLPDYKPKEGNGT